MLGCVAVVIGAVEFLSGTHPVLGFILGSLGCAYIVAVSGERR